MGLSFESAGTRVGRVEEAIEIIKQFFTREEVNFSGKYYTITGMKGLPKAARQPHLPSFIGSGGKGMLPLAALEAQGIVPAFESATNDGGPDYGTRRGNLS